ncbi:MAG: hypothetical protein HZY79_08525 [Rhodoblastus sp.]|nr:MAG: hypothetical protein HZY79_08525 [Rhodoblastus sp.]
MFWPSAPTAPATCWAPKSRRSRKSAPATRTRVYLAIFETPKGRTTLVCATARQAWDKALPIFRDIRAGITLPR